MTSCLQLHHLFVVESTNTSCCFSCLTCCYACSVYQATQLDATFLDAFINLGNVLKEARIFDR